MIDTVFHLDWLQFSVAHDFDNRCILPASEAFAVSDRKLVPLRNYNSGLALNCARIDWHSQQPRQRKQALLSGDDLSRASEEYGLMHRDLAHFVSVLPALSVSRLDVTVDLIGCDSDPIEVLDAFKAGKCKTHASQAVEIQKHKKTGRDGITVQIGSRQSQTCLRVYDKAAERGKGETDWIRLELELKSGVAQRTLKAIGQYGLIVPICEAFRGYIVTGVDWFDSVFTDGRERKLIEKGERKMTDWERWVLEVALPNVSKALEKGVPGVWEGVVDAIGKMPPREWGSFDNGGNID